MYLEHFQLSHAPFQETPDPALFFPDAGRQEIFSALLEDVRNGKPLVKLIGTEGSGKTLLCHLLCQELSAECVHVYIDNPVGSFEDLMRIACFDLGMDPATESRSAGYQTELRELLDGLRAQGKRTVLVIDEAEKLFLATLERVIRLICETADAQTLCVVLAGRPSLEANLEQLSLYCANVDVHGGHELLPMDRQATADYLDFRLIAAGVDRTVHKEVFTPGAVDKIFAAAAGNFRLTNILAEESLQTSCTEKSFLVLLDHVDSQQGQGAVRIKRSRDWGNLVRHRWPLGLAGLVLLVGGGLFLWPEDAPVTEDSVAQLEAVDPSPVLVPVPVPEMAEEEDRAPVEPAEAEPAPAPAEPEMAETGLPADAVIVEPAQEASQPKVEQPLVQLEPPETTLEPEPVPSPSTIVTKPVQVIEPLDTPEPEATVGTGPGGLPVLRARARKHVPTQSVSDPVLEEEVPVVVAVPAPVEQPVISNGRNGDLLFEERLRASAGWVGGAYRGAYTIQLMMLTSDLAATNIKKMLVQDAYHGVQDQLYILRKKTLPPTIFVFYGTYPTMEAARQARNSMPIFLRKHHPYALSIRDALHKTED